MLFNITNHQGNPNPDPSEISHYPSENSYSKRQQGNKLFGNMVPRFLKYSAYFAISGHPTVQQYTGTSFPMQFCNH